MPIELKVPSVGESITEVQIGDWLKSVGDPVKRDEVLVMIETDKVTVELPAPMDGRLAEIKVAKGQSANVGDVIGYIEEGTIASAVTPQKQAEQPAPARGPEAGPAPVPAQAQAQQPAQAQAQAPAPETQTQTKEDGKSAMPPSMRSLPPEPRGLPNEAEPASARQMAAVPPEGFARVMPAARRALSDSGIQAVQVQGTGPGGRILKEDVERVAKGMTPAAPATTPTPAPALTPGPATTPSPAAAPPPAAGTPAARARAPMPSGSRQEEVVAMTPMRKRIAERLVQSLQTTAQLTTFNEIDMSAVYALRKEFQERFVEKYGIKLGIMSFFVKAAIEALKVMPEVNAEIRGTDIIYKNYYDIGVAVGSGKGLVVPIIRNVERLSFAELELAIADYAKRAQEGKLKLEELQGGTFTVSNGGVYGNLLSTPIINPPQSAILGMHAIQERPVVREGQIVVKPMMYVAVSYDHRLIDGREAVTFLKRIKECVEQPSRILLEV